MRKLVFLFATMSAGCFTMVNQHAAEVQPPGKFEFLVGAVLNGEGDGLPAFDVHVGVFPRVQMGIRWDVLSLALEARIQLLNVSEAGVDVSLEGGAGTSFLTPFYYGGLCVSRRFDLVTPYFHIRYMEPKIDFEEGEDVTFAEELYLYAADGLNTALQLFLGAEIEISRTFLVVPEVVCIPTMTDDDGQPYFAYNVGFRFRFGRPEPPFPGDEVAPVAPSE